MNNTKRNPVDGTQVKGKKKRIPMGARNVLTVDGIPAGKVGRWVNDLDNRVAKAQDAGYEFLNKDNSITVGDRTVNTSEGVDSLISKIVGTDRITGEPITAYLMVQDQEYYDEDQREKQRLVSEKEAVMKKQNHEKGRYGKVSIGYDD